MRVLASSKFLPSPYNRLISQQNGNVTGKRAERTKLDFRCLICCSAIDQASCLVCARSRQLTFPFCCSISKPAPAARLCRAISSLVINNSLLNLTSSLTPTSFPGSSPLGQGLSLSLARHGGRVGEDPGNEDALFFSRAGGCSLTGRNEKLKNRGMVY